ncbi:MAG: hypothetical protein L6R38_007744 [Xanthoria sp. 2 TBL-2021]|nr:MAG: hypothetical protein L6R38_007744 [Xanthoria sp. 2 TBL-2021]
MSFRPCKHRKVKCGEEKPHCQNCERAGETCDYSIRLNWEGRNKRKAGAITPEPPILVNAPLGAPQNGNSHVFRADSAGATQRRPPLRKSESQNSTRSLESIEEYKKRLQFTPEDTPQQTSDHNPSHSWLDPALTNYTTQEPSGQELSFITREQSRGTGVYQNEVNIGPQDSPASGRIPRMRDLGNAAYPSPSSNVDSPPASQFSVPATSGGHSRTSSHTQMPPPFQSSFSAFLNHGVPRKAQDDLAAAGHGYKRRRLSPGYDPLGTVQPMHSPQYNFFGSGNNSTSMAVPGLAVNSSSSPTISNAGVPPTPTASSVTSDDTRNRSIGNIARPSQESPDLRRLSVKSLLSDDSPADSGNETPYIASSVNTPTIEYGVDRGAPDLDLPRNHDAAALDGLSPSLAHLDYFNTGLAPNEEDNQPPEFGFGLYGTNSAHDQGGYYAKAVTVTIPRVLTPLPPILQDNKMNLLYFHHYINHTARILVPHDCSANPFRSILPQMAIHDINLLHLLLAYSASHRALLLKHPEPATRIATWVKDVFPTLRNALNDADAPITSSNLATAIMLASLEIISPNAFEVTVPWQTHLTVARRMIVARGGAQSVRRKDKVSYFLSRWFAYLDILGSLSGGKNDQPLFSGNYWANDDLDEDFQIDCLLGFTSRCVSILARIAELARQCDSQRISSETGDIIEEWTPDEETLQKAKQLKLDLQDARMHRYKGCPHRPSTPVRYRKRGKDGDEAGWDLLEMVATNEAFHWAGLIHLDRRILGKKSEDVEVQIAVREIVSALYKVRKGGTAEACLLFPIFTAGCDAREQAQREVIMERISAVEETGMTQVNHPFTISILNRLRG